jgi:hypothetical protein
MRYGSEPTTRSATSGRLAATTWRLPLLRQGCLNVECRELSALLRALARLITGWEAAWATTGSWQHAGRKLVGCRGAATDSEEAGDRILGAESILARRESGVPVLLQGWRAGESLPRAVSP